jgi:hypothetical protein
MTAQVPETVVIDGQRYELCGVRGEGLFDAAGQGIETAPPDTSCWRGCICGYAVDGDHLLLDAFQLWSEPSRWRQNRARLEVIFGDRLELDDEHTAVDAEGLALLVPFTGGLLVGTDFIDEEYDHRGFQPALGYRTVLELTFENGLLLAKADLSAEMASVRERIDHNGRNGKPDLVKWVDDSFRLGF